jgi:signal transduction histidine kinase
VRSDEVRVRPDLIRWMIVLRRITVLVVFGASMFQRTLQADAASFVPAFLVFLAVSFYNELGNWLCSRVSDERLTGLVNVQVALDVLTLTAILHFNGGIASPGLFFFVPLFFVYGVVLPIAHAFTHVAVVLLLLSALWVGEQLRLITHQSPIVYPAPTFLLTLATVGSVTALCAYMSRLLTEVLHRHDNQNRTLVAERAALLASHERDAARVRALLARNDVEAARVRALLDVAQLVSGTHSVEALLRAVCDTTVALVRVPRVEIFLWDGEHRCLRLASTRGYADDTDQVQERTYAADVPIVARLRAGEVVDFEAAPSHVFASRSPMPVPFRRGFAAPMVCRGSFEGALFVGYDEEKGGELKELVQGIARQAALALVNVRAMSQQQEDAEVSGGLLQISQALSACLDEEALWTLLVRGASDVLGVPWVIAARFEERTKRFSVADSHGVPPAALQALTQASFKLEDLAPLQELLTKRELVICDRAQSPAFHSVESWGAGSWLAIPLFRGSWVAGFIVAGTQRRGLAFTPRQTRLADGLGHHASIALQNARLVADIAAADKLKSEFVSTMSHELRTPLNVIIGYTEMMKHGAAGPVTDDQMDLLERLDARGRELLELIEATLYVGRLEAGRDTVQIAPMPFEDLMKALQSSTAGLPRPPKVAFEWELPRLVPERIRTDRTKVALVVRNLVSNAFKFTSEGSVVVRLLVQGDTLVIDVRDTGIGIGAEHLPIIFEMFRQVDGSLTRRHDGVGLGLYIVKQSVSRLGGSIDVKSMPGKGSTFRITLPGVIADQASRAA